jgi:hypothetical protein
MWPRFGLKNSLKVAANQAEINTQSTEFWPRPVASGRRVAVDRHER